MKENDIRLLVEYPHILGNMAGYSDLGALHSVWINYLFNSRREHRSLQAHRGSYKTSSVTIIGSIFWSLFHPEDSIGIVRKTFSDSSGCVKRISNIMNLDSIKAVFHSIHGKEPVATVSRAEKLEYSYKRTLTDEGSFNAFSIKSSPTGKHCDVLLFDDFVTIEDRMSPAERKRTIGMMEEYINNVLNPGGLAIFLGTPWHVNDAWSLCPEPKKYTCHETGLMTEEEIAHKRQRTTHQTFSVNYELKHVASAASVFQNAKFCRWSMRNRGGIGHIDKSYFGSDTSALTFVAKKSDGRFQAFGKIFEDEISNHWDEVKELHKKYHIGTIHTENNDDKGFCSRELAKMGVPVETYHESKNKHIKIIDHVKANGFWSLIDWDYDTDPNYLAQILDYSEGSSPDDAPDSLASLGRIIIDGENYYINRWD